MFVRQVTDNRVSKILGPGPVSRRETEHDMGLFESKKTHSSHSSAHGPSDRSGKYTLHIQSPLSLYTQYLIYHAYLHPAIRLSHGPPQELNLPRHISKPETSPWGNHFWAEKPALAQSFNKSLGFHILVRGACLFFQRNSKRAALTWALAWVQCPGSACII